MSNDNLTQAEKNMVIAEIFVNDNRVIMFNGSVYFYHEGIWREESIGNTKAWIIETHIKEFAKILSRSQVLEVLCLIEACTYKNEIYRKGIKYKLSEQTSNEICLKDGILDLDTMNIKQYTEDAFKFSKLHFNLKNNYSAPLFFNFLDTTFSGDKNIINFVQEWFGYSLMTGNPYEKALIMTSKGRNGKGTLIHVWSKMLGKENCSSLSLSALNDEKHIEATKNKVVNFSYDSTKGGQLDTETVKQAISCEPVQASTKYKPNFSFNFTAKLIIACNDLPFTSSTNANVKDRFHILSLENEISEEDNDPYLKQKLEKEVEDIFSWAVEGLRRLTIRGHFEIPKACQDYMAEYLIDNDNVQQWLDDLGLAESNRRGRRSEIWVSYRDWANEGGMRPLGRTNFFKRLRQKGFQDIKTPNAENAYFVHGLKPPENSPDKNNKISYINNMPLPI